jgi:hypothetical protein
MTDPLTAAGIIGGVASGAYSVAKGAQELARFFLEKEPKADLQLVGRQGTVEDLKGIRDSSDYKTYCEHVKDKQMRQWIRLGLLFRSLYAAPDDLLQAKNALRQRGGTQAVAVAQAVQFDAISILQKTLSAGLGATGDLGNELRDFLAKAADLAYFVQADQDLGRQTREVQTRILAHNPSVFIVAGSGYAAEMAQEICKTLRHEFPRHELGTMGTSRDFQGVFAVRRV